MRFIIDAGVKSELLHRLYAMMEYLCDSRDWTVSVLTLNSIFKRRRYPFRT
jgi:hypothetical protein